MNRVYLQATKFVDWPKGGAVTFGWRMYDDHEQVYENILERIPDDCLELLQIVMDSGNRTANDMLDFISEHEKGISINDEWFEWDEIKHMWEK